MLNRAKVISSLVTVIAGAALLVPYQNCAKAINFNAIVDENGSTGKTGNSDDSEIPPGSVPPAVADDPHLPSENDGSDGEIDADLDGRSIGIKCATGARDPFTSLPDLSQGEDFAINGLATQQMTIPAVRTLSLQSLLAHQVKIAAAQTVTLFKNLSAHRIELLAGSSGLIENISTHSLNLKIGELAGVSKISGHIARISAVTVSGDISGLSSHHICVSANRFGSVHDISTHLLKIVGRGDSHAPANAENIYDLSAHHLVVARVKAKIISNVTARLIIRDSEIDEIRDSSGEIHLINSTVGRITNHSGSVRSRNSTVLN